MTSSRRGGVLPRAPRGPAVPAHLSSTRHTHTDGVDVGLVTREGLPAHAVPDVPQLDRGVAGPRDEGALIRGQGQAHDVAGVAREHRGLLTRLDVPQGTEAKREHGSDRVHARGRPGPARFGVAAAHQVVSPELVMI